MGSTISGFQLLKLLDWGSKALRNFQKEKATVNMADLQHATSGPPTHARTAGPTAHARTADPTAHARTADPTARTADPIAAKGGPDRANGGPDRANGGPRERRTARTADRANSGPRQQRTAPVDRLQYPPLREIEIGWTNTGLSPWLLKNPQTSVVGLPTAVFSLVFSAKKESDHFTSIDWFSIPGCTVNNTDITMVLHPDCYRILELQ
ncbi:uncharacterized protein LOC127668508 [Apodemus sylvaticus]|uniref:uncharacterized protein LOC127668508 n=1 Tax=Apodemus sylvaticus TaxID=10129 RepID=UPI0022432C3B|nr:uncharacterized protein LOC127668508 [Apodemus sylvaticus]